MTIREKLGLSEEATEEEVLAKLSEKDGEIKTLKETNASLTTRNEELSATVKEKDVDLEKLRGEVKEKYEKDNKEEGQKEEDLFTELSENKVQ